MSDFILTRTQIRSGLYQGILTTKGRNKTEPDLELRLLGSDLCSVTVTPDADAARTWLVSAKIPASSISEGVQTFSLRDAISGSTLDSFAIVAGDPLEEDLRAKIALLRAELDMLKESFRKHCSETLG